MKFTGKEDHSISLDDAAKMTKNARKSGKHGNHKGGFFGREAIEKLLAQPGVVGIRHYHAAHDNGDPALVLVGVDQDGNDMVRGTVLERNFPCPPDCGESNALNS